ncbi:dienelactone hydrolase family protein [Rhodovibrio salinarum]|nr:dienelactone hydrolase family protein [Rhodovibrio salinarum]
MPAKLVLTVSLLAFGLTSCAGVGQVDQRIPREVAGQTYGDAPDALPVRTWGFPDQPADGAGEKRPAAILLHGCSGWYGDRIPDWGERLSEAGWVAVAVDSHAVRGAPDCDFDHPAYPSNLERRIDAYAALSWLSQKPFVDASRVAAIGFSDGGRTALDVVSGDTRQYFFGDRPDAPRFAASVAYYPGCDSWTRPQLAAPTQIIVGAEDDWTPAPPCRHWRDIPAGDTTVEVHIIENATHGFNLHTWEGHRLGPRTYDGHRLIPNGQAEAKAETYATDFLTEHVAPVEP